MLRVTDAAGRDAGIELLRFSGGELHPRVSKNCAGMSVCQIRADIAKPDDVIELLLVTDALRRLCGHSGHKLIIDVLMPYFPYARLAWLAVGRGLDQVYAATTRNQDGALVSA